MEALYYDLQEELPDLLIVSGDLTNNGEKQSHIELVEYFKKIEELGTRVYVIPGNHDILNPWAVEFKGDNQLKVNTIDSKDFSNLYAEFGYNEAIATDENSLSYLINPYDGLMIFMLDTNQYVENNKLQNSNSYGLIQDHTLEWMKQYSELAIEKNAKILTVMHHNILPHNEGIKKGYAVDSNNVEEFKQMGIQLVLSGHVHFQDICSDLDAESSNALYDIATGALSVFPHKYGVLNVENETITYTTKWVNVEKWAEKLGIEDENLLNFKSYSENSFTQMTEQMVYERFDKAVIEASTLNQLAKTMGLLNVNFFAGTEYKNSWDLLHSKGYQLLKTSNDRFLREYALSISQDDDFDDNDFTIKCKQVKKRQD